MIKRYLIEQTINGREKPCAYIGTGSYVLPYPMPAYVKEQCCYKTLAHAEKHAEKLYWIEGRYSSFRVIEILV